jgi:flagella basal body P-ring formation protein FlgA
MNSKDCTSASERHTSRSGADAHGRRARGRGVAAAVCVATSLLCAPAFGDGPPGAAPSGPAVVRLWPTAVVTEDHVRLADLGRIDCDDATLLETLRACVVCPSPAGGASTVLSLADVSAALRAAELNPARVKLCGASRCEVSRPQRPAPAPAVGTAGSDSITAPAPTSQAAAQAEARVDALLDRLEPEPGTLEAFVTRHLATKLEALGGRPQIRFSPAARGALALASPTYQFRIRDANDNLLGLVSLEVDVVDAEGAVQTVPILAEVSLIRSVVVARTAINRREGIKPKHLMLAERQFLRVSDIGLTDLAALYGQQACRFIAPGTMLTARDVKARALIQRGDIVTVWARQGDLVIKTVAKAQADGVYGEEIEVKNVSTGEAFPVTVTGPRTAELARTSPMDVYAQESTRRGAP